MRSLVFIVRLLFGVSAKKWNAKKLALSSEIGAILSRRDLKICELVHKIVKYSPKLNPPTAFG
jgi:hypothetical protein